MKRDRLRFLLPLGRAHTLRTRLCHPPVDKDKEEETITIIQQHTMTFPIRAMHKTRAHINKAIIKHLKNSLWPPLPLPPTMAATRILLSLLSLIRMKGIVLDLPFFLLFHHFHRLASTIRLFPLHPIRKMILSPLLIQFPLFILEAISANNNNNKENKILSRRHQLYQRPCQSNRIVLRIRMEPLFTPDRSSSMIQTPKQSAESIKTLLLPLHLPSHLLNHRHLHHLLQQQLCFMVPLLRTAKESTHFHILQRLQCDNTIIIPLLLQPLFLPLTRPIITPEHEKLLTINPIILSEDPEILSTTIVLLPSTLMMMMTTMMKTMRAIGATTQTILIPTASTKMMLHLPVVFPPLITQHHHQHHPHQYLLLWHYHRFLHCLPCLIPQRQTSRPFNASIRDSKWRTFSSRKDSIKRPKNGLQIKERSWKRLLLLHPPHERIESPPL